MQKIYAASDVFVSSSLMSPLARHLLRLSRVVFQLFVLIILAPRILSIIKSLDISKIF